jgi:hypothetical protein
MDYQEGGCYIRKKGEGGTATYQIFLDKSLEFENC